MARAVVASSNPLAGVVDLIVNNAELRVAADLVPEIAAVPGVRSARARVWGRARLTDGRGVMVIGVDLRDARGLDERPDLLTLSPGTAEAFGLARLLGQRPVVVGRQLDLTLPADASVIDVIKGNRTFPLVRAGSIGAHGAWAVLDGDVLLLDQDDAAEVLGYRPGQVNRIDVVVEKATDVAQVRQAVAAKLAGRAIVQSPAEQNRATGSAMAGFRTGFALCGIAALVVGMFLVYNALAVTVAERRHEIGILRAVGATRTQIGGLFAGEAALLGLAGAVLGIPCGVGLAQFGLAPMHAILNDVFVGLDVRAVELTPRIVLTALVAGLLAAVGAALLPAIQAAREDPADAVRRAAKAPTGRHLSLLAGASAILIAAGTALTLLRGALPRRVGTFGGMTLVLVGALVAAPLAASVAAAGLRPLARRYFPVAWRLAADNLLQAPGRTGMVIGALAAGVALVMQTAGTIQSNRVTLRAWIEDAIAADVMITAGSALGAGGQTEPMDPEVGTALAALPAVDAVLAIRMTRVNFRGAEVLLIAADAGLVARLHAERLSDVREIPMFRRLDARSGAALVSENFAALNGVAVGDTITLPSDTGPVRFEVVGTIVDYGWSLGTIWVNRRDYLGHWHDPRADVYDLYLKPGHEPAAVKEAVASQFGARFDLQPLTRAEVVDSVDRVIERVYGIAYGQQVVVMLVAGLGVVTSLLISVLQRRREIGLLRAVGATPGQVVHSVLAEACLIGTFGTVLGLMFGVPLEWYILRVVILEESGFLFPVYVPWTAGLLIAVASIATASLAGLGPAIHAVRQRIPEAIAYE